MTEPIHIVLLFALGVVGGFQNVMAGGGSLLTLPMLIFMMQSDPAYAAANVGRIANGTNRVAILIQNIFAVAGFRRKGQSNFSMSLKLAAFTLPGAILGAIFAGQITSTLFKKILGFVVIGAVILMTQKKRLTAASTGKANTKLGYLAMLGLGFYGGFIQAGIGFLMIVVLHGLMSFSLLKANVHKVFIILIYTVPALIIFAVGGNVVWRIGLFLAAGNATGAWLGTHFAVKKGEKFIRLVLFITLLVMAVKLIFFE